MAGRPSIKERHTSQEREYSDIVGPGRYFILEKWSANHSQFPPVPYLFMYDPQLKMDFDFLNDFT